MANNNSSKKDSFCRFIMLQELLAKNWLESHDEVLENLICHSAQFSDLLLIIKTKNWFLTLSERSDELFRRLQCTCMHGGKNLKARLLPAQFCLSHQFCLDIHSNNLGIKTEKLPSYHLILLTFIPTPKYLQKITPKNTFNKHSQINTLSEMPSAKHLQKDLQKITFKK